MYSSAGKKEERILGIEHIQHGVFNTNFVHKKLDNETYNSRVALWQIPYDKRFSSYDTDKSSWLESVNKNFDNEIERVEKNLNISLTRYKVYSKIQEYDDGQTTETSVYPNGNRVKVIRNNNYVFTKITDKEGNVVAEKYYNYESNDGRKIIHKHIKQDNNTFTIVRVFSYDTTKNRRTDVINYGYTSLESTLTNGCKLEKEYYLLNGKEVKAEKTDESEFCVKDEKGNKIIFTED